MLRLYETSFEYQQLEDEDNDKETAGDSVHWLNENAITKLNLSFHREVWLRWNSISI